MNVDAREDSGNPIRGVLQPLFSRVENPSKADRVRPTGVERVSGQQVFRVGVTARLTLPRAYMAHPLQNLCPKGALVKT